MIAREAARLIWASVSHSLGKSLLTALGIGIGIAAVSLLTSLGSGLQLYMLDQFSLFGTRIIIVNPGKDITHGIDSLLSSVRPLSLDDAQALVALPGVAFVVPVVQGVGAIEYGNRQRKSDILGVGSQMSKAWQFKVSMGRFLPEDPSGHSRNYAVLGSTMKQELFANTNPLGKSIRVGGLRFKVIGVIEKKGQMLGFDMDDLVYIPTDKALQLFNREGLMEIDITFNTATSSAQLAKRVKRVLIERHGDEDFSITTQDEMLLTMGNVLNVLTIGVAALGSISLFVGAVGIATIMTTTVRERSAEIGLLRAIGASQRQVLGLFLGEAVLISLLGGVIGLALLAVIAAALSLFIPALPLALHPFFLILALLASAVIGLLAGVIPAYHASRLNPIDALRAE